MKVLEFMSNDPIFAFGLAFIIAMLFYSIVYDLPRKYGKVNVLRAISVMGVIILVIISFSCNTPKQKKQDVPEYIRLHRIHLEENQKRVDSVFDEQMEIRYLEIQNLNHENK